MNGHTTNISKLKGADLTNLEYHRLIALREKLVQDPGKTLTAISTSIDSVFSKYGINSNSIQTIETTVNNIDSSNFENQLQGISETMGHVGFTFFLE